MNKYTLIGVYPDNEQTWIDHVEATTPSAAVSQGPENVQVIAVFAGHLTALLSFEMNGAVAYIQDEPPAEEKEEPLTIAVLRRWTDSNSIIALFPFIKERATGFCSSFEHLGQHANANYAQVITATMPVDTSEPDAAELLNELCRPPYTYHLSVHTAEEVNLLRQLKQNQPPRA